MEVKQRWVEIKSSPLGDVAVILQVYFQTHFRIWYIEYLLQKWWLQQNSLMKSQHWFR